MSNHTSGKIGVGAIDVKSGPHKAFALWADKVKMGEKGTAICLFSPVDKVTKQDEANAQRIETLWNALDGVDTEDIGNIVQIGRIMQKMSADMPADEIERYVVHGAEMEGWLRKLDAIFHHATDCVDGLMAGDIRDLLKKMEDTHDR